MGFLSSHRESCHGVLTMTQMVARVASFGIQMKLGDPTTPNPTSAIIQLPEWPKQQKTSSTIFNFRSTSFSTWISICTTRERGTKAPWRWWVEWPLVREL